MHKIEHKAYLTPQDRQPVCIHMWWFFSLVPRPSHCPVLITCGTQNRGGRPGSLYHVNDVSVYLGRQRWGGIPHHKIALCVHLLCFEPGAVHFSLHECSKLQSLFEPETTYKIRLQVHSFDGGPIVHLDTVLSLIIRTSNR